MQFAIRILSFLLIGIRVALSTKLILDGGAGGIVVGISGLLVVHTTCMAWFLGKPDLSWRGLCIGLGYLDALLLIPSTESSNIGAVIWWQLFFAQLYVRWILGRCCTVTGPVFVRVIAEGPYKIIRHP